MGVHLPEAAEVLRMLKILLGAGIAARTEVPPKVPNLRKPAPGVVVSSLVDDAGATSGALLVDRIGSIYLGGTLLVLPPAALKDQLKQGAPT